MEQKEQDRIIREFVAHLSEIKGIPLEIICWPDKVNRSGQDIDAIAEEDGIRIAIEHTTIDTVPKQREDSDRFVRVFGGLKEQLQSKVTDRIRLTVHFYAVPNGISWSTFRQRLKEWLEEKILGLSYGSAYYDVPDFHFKVHIDKRPSKNPSFRVGRYDPKDKTLPERIASSLTRKTQKLIDYKKKGYETFLLIENDDIALMNIELMASSVKTAMKEQLQIEGIKIEEIVDEIWYADSSIADDLEFWPIWSKNSPISGKIHG